MTYQSYGARPDNKNR